MTEDEARLLAAVASGRIPTELAESSERLALRVLDGELTLDDAEWMAPRQTPLSQRHDVAKLRGNRRGARS